MKTTHILSSSIVLGVVALFAFAPWSAAPVKSSLAPESSSQVRSVEITYATEVHGIPANAKRVEIWLPYPQSDDHQKVLKSKVSSPVPSKILTDPQYQNKIVHIDLKNPEVTDIPVTLVFSVVRTEYVHNDFPAVVNNTAAPDPSLDRWLQPDRLVPLDKRIQELSATVVAGKIADLAAMATLSGPATPSAAIAPTSIRFSSDWRAQLAFPRNSKSGCRWRRTNRAPISAAIIAGRNFI